MTGINGANGHTVILLRHHFRRNHHQITGTFRALDVDKGLLAIGDINITPEQMSEVQGTARDKMEKKLEEQKTAEEADRFAKMSVWEIYQPIINAVTSGYSLEVEFD